MPVTETHVEGNLLANQHHLDLLKQRVHTWHQWRQEHADILREAWHTVLIRILQAGSKREN